MVALSDILIFAIPLLIILVFYLQSYRGKSQNQSASKEKKRSAESLSKLPIVTITANNILLDNSMKMNPGNKLALEMLTKHACVFLFVIVKDQDEANELNEKMAKEFEGLVDPDHILYTQTEIGRASMSRQLEPVAHFDFDPEVVHQTSIFISTVMIAPDNVDSPHAKWKSNNFKDFMTNGNTEFFNLLRK